LVRKIIDLTYPIHPGMTTYPGPWHPIVEVTQIGRIGLEGRESRRLVLGTHTGTHVDGASHFIAGGLTVDRIPLDVLVGPAFVVKFPKCAANRAISVDDIRAQIGARKGVERVLFRYDWPSRWGNIAYYRDAPYLAPGVCQWLADIGVRLIGQDTPSPDNPKDNPTSGNDSPNHKTLLSNNVVNVEYLCNLDQVRGTDVMLIVLPLPVKDGDGAPARCIAIEES
jgi:kynurenine formamidase